MLICSANDDDLGSGTNIVNVFSNPIIQKEIGMIFQWPKTLESGFKMTFSEASKVSFLFEITNKKTEFPRILWITKDKFINIFGLIISPE